MDKLNEVLARLDSLESSTNSGSNYSRLTEIASFMDDLTDVVQQLEQSRIELEELQEEKKKLELFYDYFKSLYGTGLEVANWHQNGYTEPFDNFFDEADNEQE